MSDYKYEMQMIAEELAEERFGKEYYDLTNDQQYNLFFEAEQKWMERQMDAADRLRDEGR